MVNDWRPQRNSVAVKNKVRVKTPRRQDANGVVVQDAKTLMG